MITMRSDKKGVTLVELIIVLLVVAILSGITCVALQNMTAKTIVDEGVVGLNRVRQAIRTYYNMNGCYPANNSVINLISATPPLDVKSGELNGTYFSEACYSITGFPSPGTGKIICWVNAGSPNINIAPKADAAAQISTNSAAAYITIYFDTGIVKTHLINNSGYPSE